MIVDDHQEMPFGTEAVMDTVKTSSDPVGECNLIVGDRCDKDRGDSVVISGGSEDSLEGAVERHLMLSKQATNVYKTSDDIDANIGTASPDHSTPTVNITAVKTHGIVQTDTRDETPPLELKSRVDPVAIPPLTDDGTSSGGGPVLRRSVRKR